MLFDKFRHTIKFEKIGTLVMLLLNGCCRKQMKKLQRQKIMVDAVVTDPPYHFNTIVERFGKEGSAPAQFGTDGAFKRHQLDF